MKLTNIHVNSSATTSVKVVGGRKPSGPREQSILNANCGSWNGRIREHLFLTLPCYNHARPGLGPWVEAGTPHECYCVRARATPGLAIEVEHGTDIRGSTEQMPTFDARSLFRHVGSDRVIAVPLWRCGSLPLRLALRSLRCLIYRRHHRQPESLLSVFVIAGGRSKEGSGDGGK